MSEIKEVFNAEENITRLRKGSLLFARDSLTDPNFSATVVLICEHSPDGSYGLVLNRLSHMPLSEIFNSIDTSNNKIRKVHLGGPVQESELQILNITDSPVRDAVEVVSGVYLGGYWENIEEIVCSKGPQLHLFLGYSGWGQNQLENEIKLGGWDVLYSDIREILSLDKEPWNEGLGWFRKNYCHM